MWRILKRVFLVKKANLILNFNHTFSISASSFLAITKIPKYSVDWDENTLSRVVVHLQNSNWPNSYLSARFSCEIWLRETWNAKIKTWLYQMCSHSQKNSNLLKTSFMLIVWMQTSTLPYTMVLSVVLCNLQMQISWLAPWWSLWNSCRGVKEREGKSGFACPSANFTESEIMIFLYAWTKWIRLTLGVLKWRQ